MRTPAFTKQFRRDHAKIRRSGKKIQKLEVVLDMLIDGLPLPPKYNDHAVRGELRHLRDCHIEGDWLLLYEIQESKDGTETIIFHATDTHENLFG